MPQEIIGASELIIGSWKNLRRRWPTYLEFAGWFIVLGAAQWGAAMASADIASFWSRAVFWLLIDTPLAVLFAWVAAALIINTSRGLDGPPISIATSFKTAWGRLLPLIIVSLLTVLCLFGGLLVFLVGVIFVFILLRFADYAVLIDKAKPTAALAASWRLYDGRFWPTAWRVLVIFAYFLVFGNLVAFTLLALAGTAMADPGLFFGPVRDWTSLPAGTRLIMTVIASLSAAVTMPLVAAAELMLWKDLKKNP